MTGAEGETIRTWLQATAIRIIRTSAAAALASIGAAAVFDDINWGQVAGATALAAIVTFLMCLAGLPEAHTEGPLEQLLTRPTSLKGPAAPDE